MKIFCFNKKKVTSRLCSHSLILPNPFHTHLAYSVSFSPASLPGPKANIISGGLRTKKSAWVWKSQNPKQNLTFVPLWTRGCYRGGTAHTETRSSWTRRSAQWSLSPHWRWTGWAWSCWARGWGWRSLPAPTRSQGSASPCAAAAAWTDAGFPSATASGARWCSARPADLHWPPTKQHSQTGKHGDEILSPKKS